MALKSVFNYLGFLLCETSNYWFAFTDQICERFLEKDTWDYYSKWWARTLFEFGYLFFRSGCLFYALGNPEEESVPLLVSPYDEDKISIGVAQATILQLGIPLSLREFLAQSEEG